MPSVSEGAAAMIVTLTGNNDYQLTEYVRNKKLEYIKQYGDLAVEQVDSEETEADKIIEALQSLPFLVAAKLVILLEPSKNKKFTELFAGVAESVSDNVEVIIVEPKPDKRSVYYKTLKSKTQVKEFNELDISGLATWLVAEAKTVGATLSLPDARYLVERVGTNQLLLSKELEKLVLYDKQVTRQNIDNLTARSPQSSIFDLIDAAISGNVTQALELYEDQRQQKVEPQQVIAMLAWQLHVLALVKSAGDKSPQQISAEAKINPFVVGKTQKLARNLSYQDVKQYVHDLFELDTKLKQSPIDANDALQGYILSLSRK